MTAHFTQFFNNYAVYCKRAQLLYTYTVSTTFLYTYTVSTTLLYTHPLIQLHCYTLIQRPIQSTVHLHNPLVHSLFSMRTDRVDFWMSLIHGYTQWQNKPCTVHLHLTPYCWDSEDKNSSGLVQYYKLKKNGINAFTELWMNCQHTEKYTIKKFVENIIG